MREKLMEYVRKLFASAPDTAQNRDLEEEILQNTLDHFDDLVANGVSPESAYAQAAANIGNVQQLLERPPVHDQPQMETEKKKRPGRRKTAVVVGIIVLILVLVAVGMVLLFVLSWAGPSSNGFGRYEASENVVENRIEAVTESVENWAESVEERVETSVEQAVEGVIESGIAGFSYHYNQEDSYTVGAAEVETRNVNRLVIDWVAGQVAVEPYDGETILISESEQEKEKNQLRWRQEGETLTIRYCASTGSGEASSKDLTVKVPYDLAAALQYVQISTVSADADVSVLEAGELQFDSTSGTITASGTFRILDVDTTSGGMDFAGEAGDVEIDTVSGNFTLNCSETPDELSFDSTSGDLTLLLPARRSFEAEFDTVSGEYHSEYGNIRGDALYYEGTARGGAAKFEFDTVSGDVRIGKTAADTKPA